MMKRRVSLLAAAVFVLAGMISIPLLTGLNREGPEVSAEVSIPEIDKLTPSGTETATFAMG